MRKRMALVYAGVLLCLVLAGCQYEVVSPLPGSDAGIAIPMFVNRTNRVDLSEVTTGTIIDQFLLRTSFAIVPRDRADYLLLGEIVEYLSESTTEVAAESTESRITMKVRAKLIPRSGYPPVWEETLTAHDIYSILEVDATQTENEAIEAVAREIGIDLVSLTLEGWKN